MLCIFKKGMPHSRKRGRHKRSSSSSSSSSFSSSEEDTKKKQLAATPVPKFEEIKSKTTHEDRKRRRKEEEERKKRKQAKKMESKKEPKKQDAAASNNERKTEPAAPLAQPATSNAQPRGTFVGLEPIKSRASAGDATGTPPPRLAPGASGASAGVTDEEVLATLQRPVVTERDRREAELAKALEEYNARIAKEEAAEREAAAAVALEQQHVSALDDILEELSENPPNPPQVGPAAVVGASVEEEGLPSETKQPLSEQIVENEYAQTEVLLVPPPLSATAAEEKGGHESAEEEEDEDDAFFDQLLMKAKSSDLPAAQSIHPAEPSHDAPAQPADAAAAAVFVDLDEADADENLTTAKSSKNEVRMKELKVVDHSKIDYEPFTKDFFIPPAEIARLTEQEIQQIRVELDGAKTRGANVPPPIKTWTGIGLNEGCMDVLRENGYAMPFAVQAQAIPIVMSGRDLLAIAKTGSGKTLAYVLPLVRHVFNQPRCKCGEGPIGLVMVPTHELAAQVYDVMKGFAQVSGLRVVASYGGVSLKENIAACKRGCDVMICTPGRIFDLLVANRGRVLNLRRCTFAVLDETDRMFDEGFGPHISAILNNIRPDRQVVMVSATMPKEIRRIAEGFLAKDRIELSVGGRPSPSSNVTQHFFVFDEPDDDPQATDKRWLRLLEILGEHAEERLVLIFVGAQQDCDTMFVRLEGLGYSGHVGTLYSGMDQVDREIALKRFTKKDRNILIATGVAERGIDILDLDYVINYVLPNHFEAYVNRIGRTGRAGRRGTAFSFFVKGRDDALVLDIIEGLESSGNEIPDELQTVAIQVQEKIQAGLMKRASNYVRGFKSTRGFKFTSDEKKRMREAAEAMGLADVHGEASEDEGDSDEEVSHKKSDPDIHTVDENAENPPSSSSSSALVVRRDDAQALTILSDAQRAKLETARRFALAVTQSASVDAATAPTAMLEAEYEINDFGQRMRMRLTSRSFLDEVQDATDTSIIVKGAYIDPRKRRPHAGERKLYLQIRGKLRDNIVRVFRKFDEARQEEQEKALKRHSAFHVRIRGIKTPDNEA